MSVDKNKFNKILERIKNYKYDVVKFKFTHNGLETNNMLCVNGTVYISTRGKNPISYMISIDKNGQFDDYLLPNPVYKKLLSYLDEKNDKPSPKTFNEKIASSINKLYDLDTFDVGNKKDIVGALRSCILPNKNKKDSKPFFSHFRRGTKMSDTMFDKVVKYFGEDVANKIKTLDATTCFSENPSIDGIIFPTVNNIEHYIDKLNKPAE